MKIRDNYTCPLEIVHDLIKGKWKPIIIFKLRHGPMSLSALEKGINGITEKMLLQHLSELCQYEIVTKEKGEGYPLKVSYALTEDRGQRILEAIYIMQDIGIDYMIQHKMSLPDPLYSRKSK